MPKAIRLNITHYFVVEIPNNRELQQIVLKHWCDIDFKDFMKLYKDYAKQLYSFLANNTTLWSDNPLDLGKTYYKKGY